MANMSPFAHDPFAEGKVGKKFPWVFAGMGSDEHLWSAYNYVVYNLVGTYIWFES